MNQEEQDQYQILLDADDACSAAADKSDVLSITKHFLRDFTFGAEHRTHDQGMLGIFMLRADHLPETKRISISNWSGDFVTERAKLNGYAHDPSVIMVSQANSPFTWAQGMEGADKASMAITDLCEQHTGQRNGFTFPIAGIKMLKGAATMGLDLAPTHFSPRQVWMMHQYFLTAYAKLYRIAGPFPEDHQKKYSPRQREIIQLLAQGDNVPEIARRWQTTQANVRMQIRLAMQKVDAKTQAQLVAKSIDKVPLK